MCLSSFKSVNFIVSIECVCVCMCTHTYYFSIELVELVVTCQCTTDTEALGHCILDFIYSEMGRN